MHHLRTWRSCGRWPAPSSHVTESSPVGPEAPIAVATNAKWLAACDKGNRRGSVGGYGFTILVTIEIPQEGPYGWIAVPR